MENKKWYGHNLYHKEPSEAPDETQPELKLWCYIDDVADEMIVNGRHQEGKTSPFFALLNEAERPCITLRTAKKKP